MSSETSDPRLTSFVVQKASEADVHLWGYPDDEGIKLNGGRTGAALGPDEIRKAFYKMTPPLSSKKTLKIWDGGNIQTQVPLSQRHENAKRKALESYNGNHFVMSLGGGHDYGYPDSKAFVESFKRSKKKPIVINFDAHLDVRPLDKGLTSGTPFFRLLNEHSDDLHFVEVGIQDHCNSKTHLKWCESHKGRIVSMTEIQKKGLLSALKKVVTKYKNHPCFLSVDIDAFSSAYAPGCSQAWPTGIAPDQFFETLEFLYKHLSVKGIGIYEVSPPLDVTPLTSRLAALILYRSLQMKGFL